MSEQAETASVASELSRPLPRIEEWNAPFFEGCAAGRLLLQRCRACDGLNFYPRPLCPRCLGAELAWEEVPGDGRIYSFAVVWRPQHQAFESMVPIVIAVVQLDAGPQLVASLITDDPAGVAIGQRVAVGFERLTHDIGLPVFHIVD